MLIKVDTFIIINEAKEQADELFNYRDIKSELEQIIFQLRALEHYIDIKKNLKVENIEILKLETHQIVKH